MNPNFVPTPQDDRLLLDTAATKMATGNSSTLDLGVGYAPGGIGAPSVAVVQTTALDLTSGNETYAAVLQESSDNATFTAAGPSVAITAVGVLSVPGFISKRYTRVAFTLGGTTPSITYTAWINPLGTPNG